MHEPSTGPQTTQNTSKIPLVFVTLFTVAIFHQPANPVEWIAWPARPQIALTFDDGPRPEPTLLLCEILAQYGVPATFFIVGRVAVNYPELLSRLDLLGHEVANHTWNHRDIRRQSFEEFRDDLDQTRHLIQSTTGKQTYLFRTPGSTETYLRNSFRIPAGYQLVLWNVHSLDQEGLSAKQIAKRVLSRVKSGDVVLMHNGLATTRESLRIIIPELQRRGYEFVTVSDLIRQRSQSEANVHHSTFVQG